MPGMLQPRRELTKIGHDQWNVRVWPLFDPRGPNEMTLRFTYEQYDAWQRGEYIQKAMPQLTNPEREFLMSGMTPEQWDETWKEDDEES